MSDDQDRKLTKEDVGIDMGVIFSRVKEAAKDNPFWSIKEVDFVEHFLPVFAGQEDNEQKIGDWTRMANGPGHWVAVTDIRGNVLFSVPPIQDTSVLNAGSSALAGFSAMDIVARYRSLAGAGRAQLANDYLQAHMTDFINRSKDDVNLDQEAAAWSYIFQRYNIEVAPIQSEVETAENDRQEILGFDPI